MKIRLKKWMEKVTQWFASGANYNLLAEYEPPTGAAYGGRLRLRGNGYPGTSGGMDTYWLGIDSGGSFYTGLQLNGASNITWSKVEHKTLLWWNNDPYAAFASQNISIANLSSYNYVEIWFREGTTAQAGHVIRFEVPTTYVQVFMPYHSYFAYRGVGVDSGAGIVGFGSGGWAEYNSSTHEGNNYAIPKAIYGIKL